MSPLYHMLTKEDLDAVRAIVREEARHVQEWPQETESRDNARLGSSVHAQEQAPRTPKAPKPVKTLHGYRYYGPISDDEWQNGPCEVCKLFSCACECPPEPRPTPHPKACSCGGKRLFEPFDEVLGSR